MTMKFSSTIFSEASLHGLKGPRVSFVLDGHSPADPNPRAIAIINEAIGVGFAEPELDGAPLPPEGSPDPPQRLKGSMA